MAIKIHDWDLRGSDVEDTEPVSYVVPSKGRHPLCPSIVVGHAMRCAPLFRFLPQRLCFHPSHGNLRARHDRPDPQLCRLSYPLPVAAWQFDHLTATAFHLRGAIVALHILCRTRERVD